MTCIYIQNINECSWIINIRCFAFYCNNESEKWGNYKRELDWGNWSPDLSGNSLKIYEILTKNELPEGFMTLIIENQIKHLQLPGTIKVVGNEAFSRNSIESLHLSEGIEDLGYYSFSFNKITEIIFPKTDLKRCDSYAHTYYPNRLGSGFTPHTPINPSKPEPNNHAAAGTGTVLVTVPSRCRK